MYEYNATIVRVVDGDTVHADVDLGCDTHLFLTLRLAHINAPEMSTPEGVTARGWLVEQVEGKRVLVLTIKDRREKYGRYLAVIMLGDLDINEELVRLGYAVPYEGH